MVYQLQIDADLTECPGQLISALTYSKLDSGNILLNEALRRARRAEHDLRAAQEVQSWLFPRQCPVVPGLAYAGACQQARQLGGDFYDFIGHGEGRLGVAVGDIAGKGIAAALSMATLRTLLRSQYAEKSDSLTHLLASVNFLFHESTPAATYSTLFLADYDDATRRLRYVNCGHPAPIVLHADGRVSQLASTALAIGLFADWQGLDAEIELSSGDFLAIYTDGITEATDSSGEEFRIDRLIGKLGACGRQPVSAAVASTLQLVSKFGPEQEDDMTLVGVRVL
jgi:serine phosphatase RsbU (regulator of sigma subunit)